MKKKKDFMDQLDFRTLREKDTVVINTKWDWLFEFGIPDEELGDIPHNIKVKEQKMRYEMIKGGEIRVYQGM